VTAPKKKENRGQPTMKFCRVPPLLKKARPKRGTVRAINGLHPRPGKRNPVGGQGGLVMAAKREPKRMSLRHLSIGCRRLNPP
jgi:hypothetical protein